MKSLLAPRNLPALLRLARGRVLLAFDFDGTLAPIVADPAHAQLRPRTHRLLADVARRYPCVVISGRRRADVVGRVAGIPLRRVFGNHGIEPSPALVAGRRAVRGWLACLKPRLGHLAGIVFDDKGASLAIHYRKSRNRPAALKAILAATADLADARVLKGILAVDLLPKNAPNKATALQSELRRLGCRSALYVGDDQTDEDVFALGRRLPLLAVRVGKRARSLAPYYLASQADVDALLAELLKLSAVRTANLDRGAGTRVPL
jgi:trehalose 6-phosphate phosphatase